MKDNYCKDDLFKLWGKVLKGDKPAKKELEVLYLKYFPKNDWIVTESKGAYAKSNLHTMYVHLNSTLK